MLHLIWKKWKWIEDLDRKLCKKTGHLCTGHCHDYRGTPTQSCENQISQAVHVVGASAQWIKATSLGDLSTLLKQHKEENYRLVFGNTAFGVYPKYSTANYDILIDTRHVMELYGIDVGDVTRLGANLSLYNLIEHFNETQSDPKRPYSEAFSNHIKYIAATGIRNLGCWAGNLMLKHMQPDFPSDVFLLFESIGSSLIIHDENGVITKTTLPIFLTMDMKGKFIAAIEFPTYSTNDIYIRTYKKGLRLQQCEAYVNAAFNFQLDHEANYKVKTKPTILLGGISSTKIHAEATENYLQGKSLGDPQVLKGALATLENELDPEPSFFNATYRKHLAVSLFYKYVLDVCKRKASAAYLSGGTNLIRTPIAATRDFGTDKAKFPVTLPFPKVTATYLTSGTVMYIDDLAGPPGMLFAVPVLSTIACGTIDTINADPALEVPGVVAFLRASDIPKGGVNNWRAKTFYPNAKEELLSSGPINFAGQPIGIIVADTRETATAAAEKVEITYKDVKIPIVTIEQAIKRQSFHPNPPPPHKVGNAKAAIESAKHKIEGEIQIGAQYQFHMETQSALCTPSDDGAGMHVMSSTQWLDIVQEAVAQILGLKQSQITVETQRLGGAFGAKIRQASLIAGLCALSSNVLKLPVKMHLDIHTNMKMCGLRPSYLMSYTIGCNDDGKLLGVDTKLFADFGFSTMDGERSRFYSWLDNAYYCPNWHVTPFPVKTDKPVATDCRAPDSAPAMFFMESMMDHVARTLGKDELEVRQANLYVNKQKTITQRVLEHCTLTDVVAKHVEDVNYNQRKTQVATFNKNNRWKKRGLALMPNMYGISWRYGYYTTQVMIYHSDGSVAIAHGGIDIGQGINTKVIQVCAYELNIPMEKVSVKKNSTVNNANSITTGGSRASELCCMGVIKCCDILKERMKDVKEAMESPTWEALVTQCFFMGVDMTASHMTKPSDEEFHYMCFSAASVEAEIDVLTGHYQFQQMDMLYDCGDSMNPELDIGQAEGGFVMGMGYHLTEEIVYDEKTGQILNDGTWHYKPPMPKDLPMKFNFKFQRNVSNPLGVLGSKAVAEPALTMSSAALLAVKHAIESARADAGHNEFFVLNAPATPEQVQLNCRNSVKQYTYGK